MASYTLTIYDVPQENKNIELSYNSNDGHSTKSITIGDTTWTFTLQNLSYSKAIYKPGELIFKLQISECSGVNTIYSTFKGKKVELIAKADNKSSSIVIGYYISGYKSRRKETFIMLRSRPTIRSSSLHWISIAKPIQVKIHSGYFSEQRALA